MRFNGQLGRHFQVPDTFECDEFSNDRPSLEFQRDREGCGDWRTRRLSDLRCGLQIKPTKVYLDLRNDFGLTFHDGRDGVRC